MIKIVRFFYYVGLLLWSSFLIHALFMYVAYNGIGDLFEYTTPNEIEIDLRRDSSLVYISYVYSINGEQFDNKFETSVNYFDTFGIDTVIVEYNQKLPSVSVVKGLPNMLRKQRIIIVISTIFIVLQTLFYKLATRKVNLKRYGTE